MRIFISWSGALARVVASELRTLLETAGSEFQAWMSDDDLQSGARWSEEIDDALRGVDAGILVVTRENQTRPWLNFEAGAISNALGEDARTKVIPLLVDLSVADLALGPLSRYQARELSDEGLRRLMADLSSWTGVSLDVVHRRIEGQVADFLRTAEQSVSDLAATEADPARSEREMLEEMVVTLRDVAGRARRLEAQPIAAAAKVDDPWNGKIARPTLDYFQQATGIAKSLNLHVRSVGMSRANEHGTQGVAIRISPPLTADAENDFRDMWNVIAPNLPLELEEYHESGADPHIGSDS